jgi:hypothetical protein
MALGDRLETSVDGAVHSVAPRGSASPGSFYGRGL